MTTDDDTPESASDEARRALHREFFAERDRLIKDERRLATEYKKLPTPELAKELKRTRLSLERLTSKFVEANKGLVVSYISQFVKKATSDQRDEYKAAGMEGLLEAMRSYDSANENFATWAFFGVRRAVLKAVHRIEYPGLSAREFSERPAVLHAQEQAVQDNGEDSPSASEIADRSGVSVSRVNRIRLETSVAGMDKTWGTKLSARPTVSAETGLRSDPVALDRAWQELMHERLRELPIQDVLVFIRYEGLDGWPPETFEKIGKWLGIGRERARRAHARVMDAIAAQGFEFPEAP
jgi:DNA-directed RNA polymerase specialized sigma subunit